MDTASGATVLELAHGRLVVRGWPAGFRPPFGLRASAATGSAWCGLPRLRGRVLRMLSDARVRFVDTIAPGPLTGDRLPELPEPEPTLSSTWWDHDVRGIAAGLTEVERHELVVAAIHRLRAAAIVIVRDGGAAATWSAALRQRGAAEVVEVMSVEAAARTTYSRNRQHDILAVDRPEQLSAAALGTALDLSAARGRLGFVDDARHPRLLECSAALGPVLALATPGPDVRAVEVRVSLSSDERAEYDAAWDRFLCAYDRFASARPDAGFGAFVRQARGDPLQRDAVLAWHRAVRIATWNGAKSVLVGVLLARHRGEASIVFTPDRASAYALSSAHLIAAVTAELGRRERAAILADFHAGRLRALVGPRLLDLAVPEGAARVGILVGGRFGRAQRAERMRRVGIGGTVYELVTQDTMEVGRARHDARSDAASPAVDHDLGR